MIQLVTVDPLLLRGKQPPYRPSEGTWICGGAIRQWFTGNEKPSDIDIFGFSEGALDAFRKLNLPDSQLVYETPQAQTYQHKDNLVQLIRHKYFKNIHDTLDEFDFTCCQFGWDGISVYSTPQALISVLRNHLGVHRIQPELAADSLRRAFKYQRKGFIPCAGTLKDLGMAFAGLTQQQITDQITISPNGGQRFVGID